MPCDSGPAADIGVLMGKCVVPRYDSNNADVAKTPKPAPKAAVEAATLAV